MYEVLVIVAVSVFYLISMYTILCAILARVSQTYSELYIQRACCTCQYWICQNKMMEITQKDDEVMEEWANKLKTVQIPRADMNMLVMDYLEKGQQTIV